MLGNKSFSALFAILFIVLLAGCSVEGPPASPASAAARGTLQSISLTPVNSSIAGSTHQQFTAMGTYANPTSTQDITRSVTWSSSNTNIATITNAPSVRGLAAALTTAGTTTISATYSGRTGTTRLTVTTATLENIEVTPVAPSILNGATQQFTALGTFSDGSTQNITASVTWTSDNLSVVAISNTGSSRGYARAVGIGTATITATLGPRTDSTTLTVAPPTLTSISLTPASPSVFRDEAQQFTAIGNYNNNTTSDLTSTVTWVSSDTSVATINNAGLATALSIGTTTISATLGAVSETALLTVTGSGTISLTWDAPTQYANATSLNPITDLRWYNLYYRSEAQSYTQERMWTFTDHSSSPVTQAVTLAPGRYFFVVTAVTQDFLESDYSNEIERIIN